MGNRHVLFGSGATLRDAHRLGPADGKTHFKRVGNEREGVEARIVESLVVKGFEVRVVENREFGDVGSYRRSARRRWSTSRQATDHLHASISGGLGRAEDRRERWELHLERLSLGIIRSEPPFGPGFVELPALGVWEFNQDGTVFDRARIVAEIIVI